MKAFFIKYLLFIISAISLSLLIGGCHHNWWEPRDDHDEDRVNNTRYTASSTTTYKTSSINHSRLRLIGINGDITIMGRSESDSVIIISEKRVGSESTRDAEIHLDYIQVSIQDFTNEIYVKTTQPDDSHGRNYQVNYIVFVPINFEVYTDNVNGTVSVESINNYVNVGNVNGTINLNNLYCSTLVNLVNGSIKCKQSLPLNGTINLTTVNGGINLDIPRSTSAEFSANMTLGNFTSTNLDFRNQIITLNSARGTLGGGQGKIVLNTVNGKISISGY